MATTTKKSATIKTTVKKKPAYSDDYVRLRTLLDSIEILSLVYYTNDDNQRNRHARYEDIESLLMPVIRELRRRKPGLGGDDSCPPGLRDCGGCCVPYRCM